MMRSLLQPLLALTLPALVAGAALAADPVLPVVRLSFAGFKELDAIAANSSKIGGKPERVNALHDQIKQMGWGDGAGIDTGKRWGLYAEFPKEQVPVLAVMMPVADETKFLAALKPLFPQQDKEPSGGTKLQNGKMPPLVVKVDKGYARVSMWRLVELPALADPAAVVAGNGTLALIIEAARLGNDLKANLVGGMKAFYTSAGMPPEQMKQMEPQFASAQTGADTAQKTLAPFDRLELDLTFSSDRPALSMATRETAKEDKGDVKVPASKGLITLVPANAPGGFTIDLPLVGRIREAMQKGIDAVVAKAKAGGMSPGDQEALETLAGELTAILKLGRFEAASLVEGDDKGATSITFVRLGEPSQVQAKLEKAMDKSPKKEKFKKETVDGAWVLSLDDPPKEEKGKLASAAFIVKGDLFGVALSQKPGAGARLKDALKQALAAKPVDGPGGMKGWISMVGVSKLGDPFNFIADAKQKGLEEDLKTEDLNKITLTPSPTGHTMEMSMEGFLVSQFWKGAFKDKAPGGPGMPVPGGEGPGLPPGPGADGPGLPPAPPVPDAAASPEAASPEAPASAAPEAPASPEEEKEEKDEKDRDGKSEEKGDDK